MDQVPETEELEVLHGIETQVDLVEQAKQQLENLLTGNEKSLLITAAKYGKLDLIKKLTSRGVDVNSVDDHGNLAVDYGWANKFYDVVLVLLKADSKFPKQFNLIQLDDSENSQNLKNFIEERNLLHRLIEENKLEDVQELVNKSKSKFYFNEKNETAPSVAFKRGNFQIYTYLKSIGAESEKGLDELRLTNKIPLEIPGTFHSLTGTRENIFYLMSKSISKKPVEGLENKLRDFYSKLHEIPEISIILSVIQHSDSLIIAFDFDEENVVGVDPTVSKCTKTNYNEGVLHIAAGPGRGEKKILGTIAHEITHMAMQLVFENECKPYLVTDKENFDKITKNTLSFVQSTANDPSEILFNVINGYFKEDHDCELIVTVPQILAEYENGREWLQKNASELFDFYTKKIIPNCHQFIIETSVQKAKSAIRNLNETSGEWTKLKKSNIFFKNIATVHYLLLKRPKSKIFIFRTRFTFLGMIKVLHGIFGGNYVNLSDKYLAFSSEDLKLQLKEIMQTFIHLHPCDALVIRVVDDSSEGLRECLEAISIYLDQKSNKEIFFVVNPNMEEILFQMLKEKNLWDLCAVEQDEGSSSINDLNENSRNEILSKKVIFQGEKMLLMDLIGADGNLHDLITGDIIQKLVEEKDVYIGETAFENFNSRGFGYVDEEINLRTFVNEFSKSDDIFILKGLSEEEALRQHFSEIIKEGLISDETLASEIHIIKSESFEISDKRIFLTNEFSDENFKTFCRHNRDKKIYLISVNQNDSKFTLQELYNPSFYLERQFQIMITEDQFKDLVSKVKFETFVITTGDFLSDSGTRYDYPNVRAVQEEEAETVFHNLITNNVTAHWFYAQNRDEIYWRHSSGVTNSSFLYFINLKTNEYVIDEEDVIKHAVDKKVIILAGKSGTGKSTTLAKFSESSLIAPTHWIIRINLKFHEKSIKQINPYDITIKIFIKYLQSIKSDFKDKLTESLLESALSFDGPFSRRPLFVFEGFDEISDGWVKYTTIALLQYLKNETRSKIWITTRPNHKNALENGLSTFALQFHPINDAYKRIYIAMYLLDRLKLSVATESAQEIFELQRKSKMKLYAEKFVEHMKFIFTENISVFSETPLQLYIMTENSAEHFKHWIGENSAVVDFSYLGNIYKVFRNFIDRRYEMYFRKQNISDEFTRKEEKDRAEDYCTALAESQIRNIPLDAKYENANRSVLHGVIQPEDGNNVDFIHLIFREYYVALFATKYISSRSPTYTEYIHVEYRFKYLIEVLEKGEFMLIRKFINSFLENLNFDELPKENLESFQRHFTISWPKIFTGSQFPVITKQIFRNCVKESNGNILDFILYNCESCFTESLYLHLLTLDCGDAFTVSEILLHRAISNADLRTSQILLNRLEKLSGENQKQMLRRQAGCLTILKLAVKTGHCGIVKIVFQKLEEVLNLNEIRAFLRAIFEPNSMSPALTLGMPLDVTSCSDTALHPLATNGCTEMIELLLEKMNKMLGLEEQKLIIMMQNEDFSQTTLYLAADNGHMELVKILLERINGILSDEEQKQFVLALCNQKKTSSVEKMETVVHFAARCGNTELLKILLEKSRQISSQKEFLNVENILSETPFHVALEKGHFELIEILLEEMEEILSTEELKEIIMKQMEFGGTVLHVATRFGNIKIMKMCLEVCEKILSPEELRGFILTKNDSSENILFLAAIYDHNDLMKMLLQEIEEILSSEEQKEFIFTTSKHGINNGRETMLHIAARHGNNEIMKMLLEKSSRLTPGEQKRYIMMKNGSSENALHAAAKLGYIECIKILLEKSDEILSPVEQQEFIMTEDLLSKTALHVAVENEHSELIKILLDKADEIVSKTE